MMYLGSERIITNSFINHKTAEDYAGNHLSNIKINGVGKVIGVVNKFKSHEDSINYNDYLANQSKWKDGNYYNCISITGKNVKMHYSELGGNQIYIETYNGNDKIILRIAHLAEVFVNVGDVIDQNKVIATQGNTGLVLSSKSRIDETYGSHVHLEVTDKNGTYLDPRPYSSGNIVTNYKSQSNIVDKNKRQIQIIVDKINIREQPNELSKDLGDVLNGEVYTILDEIDSELYTWYKITTNRGINGYVASKKNSNWIKIMEIDVDTTPPVSNHDKKEDNEIIKEKTNPIFTCNEDGYYYIYLYEGEILYLEKKTH